MDKTQMKIRERLARIETIVEHGHKSMHEDIGELKSMLKSHIDSQSDYVRHDDPSYFSKYMREYNESLLKKKVGWMTVLDIGFKFVVFAAAAFMTYYGLVHW